MFTKLTHKKLDRINFIIEDCEDELSKEENFEKQTMFPTPFLRDMEDLIMEIIHFAARQREQTNQ